MFCQTGGSSVVTGAAFCGACGTGVRRSPAPMSWDPSPVTPYGFPVAARVSHGYSTAAIILGAGFPNRIVLAGAVASCPSGRCIESGPALTFRLAVRRPEGDDLYVDIAVPLEVADDAVTSARLVVSGRLDHQEWVGEDGLRRSRWLVVADQVERLGKVD